MPVSIHEADAFQAPKRRRIKATYLPTSTTCTVDKEVQDSLQHLQTKVARSHFEKPYPLRHLAVEVILFLHIRKSARRTIDSKMHFVWLTLPEISYIVIFLPCHSHLQPRRT